MYFTLWWWTEPSQLRSSHSALPTHSGCPSSRPPPPPSGTPHRPSMLVEMRFGDSTSSAQPTKSPSSSIFAKSLSRSLSDRVFESGRRVGREGEGLVPPVPAFPLQSAPTRANAQEPLPRRTPLLTCHFQGLQILQAGQGTIADSIDHGAWGRGSPVSP